ncbi:hypothetical protein BKK51_03390 [Rodentibacter trehalosifermentans]|uniref:Autotransporter domain-containing protein n=1 Tax=Rodentibacter trehalosifermentans TaxID=1908263 RepID=A0A1V3IW91_9PAST|nr:autotransporter outer membrane beta-barrel domain-containing protein [Rodentibacter trehalosifermentans]OOF46221.1 hypothetical protein BKK51_03390 [Rodentibacter trehalosifermentans]
MMKKISFFLISIFPCLSYADVIKNGSIEAIEAFIDNPSKDEEEFRFYNYLIVGEKDKAELTINKGSKVSILGYPGKGRYRTNGSVTVGYGKNGDGKLIVDGEGSILKVGNAILLGDSRGNAELHITNGAKVIQVGINDPYSSSSNLAGDRNEKTLIVIDGKGSELTYSGGIATPARTDKITLLNGGTLTLPGQPLTDIENQGYLNVLNNTLTIHKTLKIGSDDHKNAGEFNLPHGVIASSPGDSYPVRLIFNKLKEDQIIFPLYQCSRCTIEYNAPENMKIELLNHGIGREGQAKNANVSIKQGTLSLTDQSTFDRFSLRDLTLLKKGTLSLSHLGYKQPFDENRLDVSRIKSDLEIDDRNDNWLSNENFIVKRTFLHQGTLDLADGSNQPNFTHFIVNHYTSGGTLLVDTVWNKDSNISGSDILHVLGHIDTSLGATIVKTKTGIFGDIEKTAQEQTSSPVVIAEKDHNGLAFVGKSDTLNAGEAQLVKIGNKYYWTLEALEPKPNKEIRTAASSTYIQMPYTNMELGYSAIDTLAKRRGSTVNPQASAQNGVWGRVVSKYLKVEGKNRLNHRQNQYLAQIGVDLDINTQDSVTKQTGIYATFGYNHLNFSDRFRAENGRIVSDKHTGKGKTKAGLFGLYHSIFWQNESYLDLVGQVGYLRNEYRPREGSKLSQDDMTTLISTEIGQTFHLNENWSLEPQTQLIYQHLYLKDLYDKHLNIQFHNQSGLRGRLGSSLNFRNEAYLFALTTNVWHDFLHNKSVKIGNRDYREDYAQTWLDVGLQFQWNATNNLSFYAHTHLEHSLKSQTRNTYQLGAGVQYVW